MKRLDVLLVAQRMAEKAGLGVDAVTHSGYGQWSVKFRVDYFQRAKTPDLIDSVRRIRTFRFPDTQLRTAEVSDDYLMMLSEVIRDAMCCPICEEGVLLDAQTLFLELSGQDGLTDWQQTSIRDWLHRFSTMLGWREHERYVSS